MSYWQRQVLLILLGLWYIQATAWAGEPSSYDEFLNHCEGLYNSFDCARAIERAQAKGKDGVYFRRNDNRLIIRLASKHITLRDRDLDQSDDRGYSYITFHPRQKIHVLHLQFYEGEAFVVIHHLTGELAQIDGFPIASPDLRRFVAISHGGESGYYPTSIEIWRVRNGHMWPEYRYESSPREWGPGSARWLDNNTIHIDGLCLEAERTCESARLSMKAGRWRIER